MKLISAILISIPLVTFFVYFWIGWIISGTPREGTLLAIISVLVVFIGTGRVWSMYFKTKKYGTQVKLDDFEKAT